jgi:hypothetical protein
MAKLFQVDCRCQVIQPAVQHVGRRLLPPALPRRPVFAEPLQPGVQELDLHRTFRSPLR